MMNPLLEKESFIKLSPEKVNTKLCVFLRSVARSSIAHFVIRPSVGPSVANSQGFPLISLLLLVLRIGKILRSYYAENNVWSYVMEEGGGGITQLEVATQLRKRQDIDKTQTRHRQDIDKTQTRHRQDIDKTQTRHRQDIDKING